MKEKATQRNLNSLLQKKSDNQKLKIIIISVVSFILGYIAGKII
jgi:hypothetical protein